MHQNPRLPGTPSEHQRSERLRQLGAEVVVGAMDDFLAVRAALTGVQRAYYETGQCISGAIRAFEDAPESRVALYSARRADGNGWFVGIADEKRAWGGWQLTDASEASLPLPWKAR